MLRRGLLALCGAAALAGCTQAPVPVAEAERACLTRARDAAGPRGEVTVGMVSENGRVRPHTGLSVSVSSDAIAGRDPAEVFNQCVAQRSGQFPTRPLNEQPGWRG